MVSHRIITAYNTTIIVAGNRIFGRAVNFIAIWCYDDVWSKLGHNHRLTDHFIKISC